MLKHCLVMAALVFFSFATLPAAIIHVPADYTTIQAAIDVSTNGDTVLVADGTYQENIDFLGKAIVVTSENGAEYTIITKAVDGLPIVNFTADENNSSVLSGFTVKDANGYSGILCVDSSPVIEYCIVEYNVNYRTSIGYFGGGILLRNNAAPIIKKNIVRNNRATHGGGISVANCDIDHQALIDSNYIYGNITTNNAAGFCAVNAAFIFTHNLVYRNDAGVGGGGARIDASGGTFANNTICFNTADIVAGGVFTDDVYSTDTYVFNNIFYGNNLYGFAVYHGSNFHLAYNCFYGDSVGPYDNIVPEEGNIYDDPLFVDALNDEYRLMVVSPCIDAGDPASPLDPNGTIADMGALYYTLVAYGYLTGVVEDIYGSPIENVYVRLNNANFYDSTDLAGIYAIDSIYAPATVNVHFALFGYKDTTVFGIQIEIDATTTLNMVMQPSLPGAIGGIVTNRFGDPIEGVQVSVVDNVFNDTTDENGEYLLTGLPAPMQYDIFFSYPGYYDTTVSNVQVLNDETTEINVTIPIPPGGTVFHVPADYSTIQAAIDVSIDGDTVIVADGMYPEHIDFLGKAIVVTSENGAENTIITKAFNNSPIVSFISGEDNSSVLNGFTVKSAYGWSGILCVGASPVIEHCIVENNENYATGVGYFGGGILLRNNAAPIIRKNIVRNNQAIHGGGISVANCDIDHQALIDSNYIYSNTTTNNAAGFCAVDAAFIFTHNLVYRNDAGLGGGAARIDASGGTFANNTICFNTAASIAGGIFTDENYSIDTYVFNNIIYGNSSYGFAVYHGSNFHLTYNCFFGDSVGPYYNIVLEEGNIFEDPLFINGLNDDYRLRVFSPCIDAGDPASPLDPDGSIADLGALYFHGYDYLPGDVNMRGGNWPPAATGPDVTYLVNMFRGQWTSEPCWFNGDLGLFWASADANGDCNVIGSDVTMLVNVFRGTGSISFCPAYQSAWPTPADLPAEMPDGWPNCNIDR